MLKQGILRVLRTFVRQPGLGFDCFFIEIQVYLMRKVHYSATNSRWSIGKSLLLSLLVIAGILFTSLVATTEKADAQIGFGQVTPPRPILSLSPGVPVAPSRILNLLTSGTGRWFEFRREGPICQIYDFKQSGVAGRLRTSRETYAFNTLFGANECRFSLGPIAIGRGVTSLVNNGAIQIVYPASPNSTERILIAGSSISTQLIAVWRGDRGNGGRPIYRVWHRSSR